MKLSIVVAVYNHENYLKQAIESILIQKVNFDYEVLIGEDCSTDSSREVLKEIEASCPDNFRFFYRETNLGLSKNFIDLYQKMKGDYFIVLEGDDYWCYEYKLQRQVDFLDSHPECIACSHNVIVVDHNSKPLPIEYPECKETQYTLNHYKNEILPGQTAANMYRNYYKLGICDTSIEQIKLTAGDRRKAFMMITHGEVHCIQQQWSCYRYITNTGSSFSATYKSGPKARAEIINFYRELIRYAMNTPKAKQAVEVAESLYILSLVRDVCSHDSVFSKKYLLKEYKQCTNKLKIAWFILTKVMKNLSGRIKVKSVHK